MDECKPLTAGTAVLRAEEAARQGGGCTSHSFGFTSLPQGLPTLLLTVRSFCTAVSVHTRRMLHPQGPATRSCE